MENAIKPILDVNFNHAREAIGEMENFVTNVPNDATQSQRRKQLRHDLTAALAEIPAQQLLNSRDTAQDVGTSITTASEQLRTDTAAVLHAAAKRLSEALRCLEEYGKVISPSAAGKIEQVRYQGY